MESLAYIHLALAYEESPSASSTHVLENLKLFEGLNKQKLSSRAWIYLLSLAVSLNVVAIASSARADLQTGSSGSEVTALQQRLRQLGYFNGRITGNFDSATRQAVVRYQQAKGLGTDGIVGSATETALSKRTTGNVRVRQNASSTTPSSDRSLSNQVRTNVSVSNNTTFLGLGSSGSTVRELQQRLKQAGFYQGAINGFFNSETEAALRQFQQAKKLTVDGIAGARTQTALLSVGRKTPSQPLRAAANNRSLQQGNKGAEVATIQRQLKQLGYYNGQIAGDFNSETREAVRKFQRQQGLLADGVAGSTTLSALEKASNQQGVQALQRRLQRSGFYQGPIDGVLSSQTKQAIAAAQQAYGIRNQ